MEEAQKGQILMVVILVMVVALTISLSVAARSVTNIRTSSEEENSEQAFSAAEAGLESSIGRNNGVIQGTFDNNSKYQAVISDFSGTSLLLNNSNPVLKDDAIDVWLSDYPDYTNPRDLTLTIYWGQASDSCQASEAGNSMAALEIMLLTGTKGAPKLTHYALDPCDPRYVSNHFEYIAPGGGSISGRTFAYKKTIDVTSGLLARIIPLYAPTLVGVIGNNPLPSQGKIVESLGSSDDTQRKIVSLQSYPKLPVELFSYTIFSPK